MQQKSVCFDTETTSIDSLQAELVGIAFSWSKGKGYYLALPEKKEEAQKLLGPLKTFLKIPKFRK